MGRDGGLDTVGAEARPVRVADDDDRSLLVAEPLDVLEGVNVLGHVNAAIVDALFVEDTVGRVGASSRR